MPSLVLGGLGVLIGAPLGILLGMAAALNRNTWIDYLASALATLGLTIPVFVISMLLILVFAVWLNWLPASGWGKPERWILPIIAYAAIPLATYARYTRSAMLDTLNQPFVTVLRAKGLSERRIIFQHVLRNSAIPMVTVFLPMFIGTATGSIFVEAMFRVPGPRRLLRLLDREARLSARDGADADDHLHVLHRLPALRHRLRAAQSAHPRRRRRAMTDRRRAPSPRRAYRQRSPLWFRLAPLHRQQGGRRSAASCSPS